jgi:hypothetical protein
VAELLSHDGLPRKFRAIDSRIDQVVYRVVLDREKHIRERLTEKLNPLLVEQWDDDGDYANVS